MNLYLKQKFDNFLNNNKDYPILVGLISGLYPILFFYSNNFEANLSLQHFVFYSLLFIVLPVTTAYFGYLLISKSEKFNKYKQHFLFLFVTEVTAIFLSQVIYLTLKKKLLLVSLLILVFISLKFYNQYKKIIVLISLMCIFPIFKISLEVISNLTNSSSWKNQPDGILNIKFKSKPNIYYIQPDGYTNENTLRDSLYKFDNSNFDNFLISKKFTLYNDFRSNYPTTLTSNTSTFLMKHHLFKINNNFNYARELIVGQNPVLEVLKNNNYKTFLISERPYLLMNHSKLAYNYSNFNYDEVPHFDCWKVYKDIKNDIKNQIERNAKTNNFFFIESFLPAHITVSSDGSLGIEKERLQYLTNLELANIWLKEIISFIDKNDPNAIIIIGADHGGFVGFESTIQSTKKINDKKLIHSIFGAKLAIKWNNTNHTEYDFNLKTPVNLFRVLFSNLSYDKSLLNNLQPDNSYNLSNDNESDYYLAIQ